MDMQCFFINFFLGVLKILFSDTVEFLRYIINGLSTLLFILVCRFKCSKDLKKNHMLPFLEIIHIYSLCCMLDK